MGATTHSIEINAPLQVVYNQWTQFEEFPHFMEGVEEVRQEGDKRLFWKAKIGGKEKQWEAEIAEQVPDKEIAWASIDGTPNSGRVTFAPLDSDRTQITLTMEHEPEGFLEMAGDVLGIPSGRVEGDLKRFRDFIEERGSETGSWRGQIGGRERHDSINQGIQHVGSPKMEEAAAASTVFDGREPLGEPVVTDEIVAAPGIDLAERVQAAEQESLRSAKPVASEDQLPAEVAPEHVERNSEFYRDTVGEAALSHHEIALRAYELYLARGRTPGHEAEDWLEAEKQLSQELTRD
jgi:Polyketide cyclase / dehydrase and lipid transport/Protein of unknown function (DUF2934)